MHQTTQNINDRNVNPLNDISESISGYVSGLYGSNNIEQTKNIFGIPGAYQIQKWQTLTSPNQQKEG